MHHKYTLSVIHAQKNYNRRYDFIFAFLNIETNIYDHI